ncbi:MAG TPA: hypothetical protein VFB00_03855 [Terriglobales bacterium]|nr:hypothetical protein [Terriglobales bacterium]
MKPRAAVIVFFALAQLALAQLPSVPGKRIETKRAAAGTPSLVGVSGTCKNGDVREIVVKVANVDSSALNNAKVQGHPPFTVVSSKVVNGDLHITVRGENPTGAAAQYAAQVPGAERCDFDVKIPVPGQQNGYNEIYPSAKAEQSDAYLAAQKKQQEQNAKTQAQIAAAQAQMQRAQPAMDAHQHASVGDKWTVHWASGQTETWSFAGMDNMTHMANFKGPGGDVKIMFAGMFYTIMQGQCAMMAQPDGQGKVSGKTMGGKCTNNGAFTASVE